MNLENTKTSFANCKKIEEFVYQLLLLSDSEFQGIKRFNINYLPESIQIVKNIKEFLVNEKILDIKLKPKAQGALYGSNREPKEDLRITTDIKSHRISIKSKDDNAYYITIGKKDDFKKFFDICSESLNLQLPENILKKIENTNSYIRYFHNYNSYNKKKGSVRDFIEYYYNKNGTDKDILEKVKNKAEQRFNDSEESQKYVNFLHEGESTVNNLFKTLFFDHPETSKKILHEFMTGCVKFSKGTGQCNVIVSFDSIHEIKKNEFNHPFVIKTFERLKNNKCFGRLQNVPRAGVTKRTLKTKDPSKILDEIVKCQMSFKI